MKRDAPRLNDKTGVLVKDLGYKRMMRELAKAPKAEVVIGYHEGEIAEYMTTQEFGSSGKHTWTGSATEDEVSVTGIPERPHMRNAFDKNIDKTQQLMAVAAGRIMDGTSTVYRELMIVGATHSERIRDEITHGNYRPNAPQTADAKGHDKVLIDTGVAFKSIRQIVRPRSRE